MTTYMPHLTVTILVYAAVSSLSLSFFATAVDSVFDPMSNLVLWRLHRLSKRLDTNKWPVGGARLQTIGNICYGTNHWVSCLLFTQLSPGFLYVCLEHIHVPLLT
jgi:divalent metal cation (Fe/Co/Zn/Cd) transporter